MEYQIRRYKIVDGRGGNLGDWGVSIGSTGLAPLGLRVSRQGNLWTIDYSLDDGATWTEYKTFTHAMTVSTVGIPTPSASFTGSVSIMSPAAPSGCPSPGWRRPRLRSRPPGRRPEAKVPGPGNNRFPVLTASGATPAADRQAD